MNTHQESSGYIPGTCNINSAEIAKRRTVGYIGLVIFFVLVSFMFITSISSFFRLILLLPAYVASIGFLQAREKFCVGYAAAGKQNATEGNVSAQNIIDESSLAKDKERATQLKMRATTIAVIVTLLALVVPPYRF